MPGYPGLSARPWSGVDAVSACPPCLVDMYFLLGGAAENCFLPVGTCSIRGWPCTVPFLCPFLLHGGIHPESDQSSCVAETTSFPNLFPWLCCFLCSPSESILSFALALALGQKFFSQALLPGKARQCPNTNHPYVFPSTRSWPSFKLLVSTR